MDVNLHKGQSKAYKSFILEQQHRFLTLSCSRGWGKSYFASVTGMSGVFELLQLPSYVPNKNVVICAPTHEQAVDIYYPVLVNDLGVGDYTIRPPSKDTGRFLFPKGVELRLISYEAIERLRGKGVYLFIWDEVSSCYKGIPPKDAWENIIEPCIITRWSKENAEKFGASAPGRALFISTPSGYNFFYDLFHMGELDPDFGSLHFDYSESPFLAASEIERLRRRLDPIKFASEYLALFKESGNSVFYCFDRKIHVRDDLEYFHPHETVHVAIDFNVGVMASSVFAVRGGQMQILDESKGMPNTEELGRFLKAKYKDHKIVAYPDPSGRARKASAPVGITDFQILQNMGITCLAKQAAPPITDSVASVNGKLKSASDNVEMLFHASCTETIRSMERTKWVDKNPNLAVIDKSEGVEHFSDGIRYATDFLFPILPHKIVKRGFNF